MLSKHFHFTGTGDREIQLNRYLTHLSIALDDVLALWVEITKRCLPQIVIDRQNKYWPFQLSVPIRTSFFHSGTDGECKAKFTCVVNS